MLKKLLCVMISALMVISVLPVGVFAADTVEVNGTTYEVLFSEDCSIAASGWGSYSLSSSDSYLSALQTDGALVLITRSNEVSSCTYENIVFVDSYWGSGAVYGTTANYSGSDSNTNVAYTFDTGIYVAYDASVVYSHCNSGGSAQVITNTDASYTITNISVIVPSFDYVEDYTIIAEEAEDSSDGLSGTLECLNASGVDFTSSTQYLYIYYTYDAADSTYAGYGPCGLCMWASDGSGDWVNVIGYGTEYNDIFVLSAEDGYFKVPLTTIYEAFVAAGVTDPSGDNIILNWWADDAGVGAYASVTKVVVGDTATSTSTRMTGAIYVNEDYHAFIINGHFLCVPHTVDSNGYCTVCKEYIGTDDAEATTVTVDGVDYVEAFVYDTTIASGNWNKVTIGDSTLAAALNTEGAILQVTRDTETLIDYVSGSIYEKFLLGKDDSNYVALSAHGTTVNDEDGLVAYTSDDGTTVTYDGATVYAALSDAGLADLSSYVLISNTSASYNITSVRVLVPVGTVVTETVDVDEPAEDTNTETEDDELDVDDNDAEEVTETNPTTGAVLTLVPMAIAGFAVVASKRR
ncbi:MAG: hypothetical protein LUH56_00055 [Oscillospiraceae bacterium]|nr:hypothetical protein [Oscillospiraceae bacterium]